MGYDKTKYKIWTWKNPLMLHWIINPGLAFNELVLGQRVPKVTLIEKKSNKTLAEKTFIPCSHCDTLHSGLKWTPQNQTAFKNWFGLYCDNCGQVIPCLTNLTSYIILVLTFPFWFCFKNKWKKQWLEEQKNKFQKPLTLTQPDFKWWYVGLGWGYFMFVFMSLFNYLIFQEPFTWKRLLLSAIFWTIGGLIFGLFIKRYEGSKTDKTNNKKQSNQ